MNVSSERPLNLLFDAQVFGLSRYGGISRYYDFFSTGSKTAVDEFLAANQGRYELSLPIKSAGHFCILEKIAL